MASWWSASDRLVASPIVSMRLVSWSASGGPAASRRAQSSTKASSSPSGTTRFTMPMRSASFASSMSPSSASSFALWSPTSRGSSQEPPRSMASPRLTKISEKRALSPATIRSQPSARLRPAPTATPFTFAMVGFGISCSARPTQPKWCIWSSWWRAAPGLGVRSAPAQKAPAEPVNTSTRSLALSPTSRNTASSSSHMVASIAFRLSGRWSATVTMPSGERSTSRVFMPAQDGTRSGSLRDPMAIELRTERLRLTPLAPADREALLALWTEPAVRRFLWDDRVIDLATVDDVIARSAASFAGEGFGLFALRRPDHTTLLGAVGIFRLRSAGEPELLYSLATACFGRGLASEASRAVINDAFQRLGFARVLARTDPPNRASLEVMKRLGMTYAGESVEGGLATVSYSLAREAWAARAPQR